MKQPSVRTESLGLVHWIGVVLAVITGVLHLWLGVQFIDSPLGWSFLAAGIGFFAGIGLVLIDYERRLVYLAGLPFTAGQIVLWVVLNDIRIADLFEPGIGVFDKVVQLLLIVVLLFLYVRDT